MAGTGQPDPAEAPSKAPGLDYSLGGQFRYFVPRVDEGFQRLSTKASQEQWAVGALPWEALGTLDADWRRGMIGILSPLLVSERCAMQACGTMLPQVRAKGDHDSELVMHAMMLDEARHWEGLNRLFIAMAAEPAPIAEHKDMLGINLLIMRGASFDQWLWGIQISDIIAGNLYAAIKSSTDSVPVQELFGGFLRDEARHHRFCHLFFAREAARFSREQQGRYRLHGGKIVAKFERLICGRLAEDMRRIGTDPQRIFEKVATAVERQADDYGFLA
jgi:hypothetical protein